MNLYFQSLLKSDIERRKNVANCYQVFDRSVKSTTSTYLKTRFPFLRNGDMVRISKKKTTSTSFFFGKLTSNLPKKFVSHPYFYIYSWGQQKIAPISKVDREKIYEAYKKKKQIYIKIGKVKYLIFLSLFSVFIRPEPDPNSMDDYLKYANFLCSTYLSRNESCLKIMKKRIDLEGQFHGMKYVYGHPL
jgi:hypothetical protein